MENSENQIIGAIKIKDGLFIGDEFASQDLEFIVTNKVTHIINCAAKEVTNSWESIGVAYLSFPWNESDEQIIFDERNDIVNEIFRFIEETATTGESCLVHSVRGQSRSCCVLAAYFMRKYRWSLYKTLEYLNSRRPDLEIRASFFHQLNDLEARLSKSGLGAKTSNWNETSENSLIDGEEIVIRNTFLNSKNMPLSDIYTNQNFYLNKEIKPKINWVDENSRNSKNIANFYPERKDNFNKNSHNRVKSILKGSKKIFINESKPTENEKKIPTVFGPYLKMNKSSKSLIDENNLKNSSTNSTKEEQKPSTPHNTHLWNKPPVPIKDLNNRSNNQEPPKVENKEISLVKSSLNSISRSSSLKVLNKEETNNNHEPYERNEKYNDILRNNKASEIFLPNGNNVIHVTVNNFVNSPTINSTVNKINCNPKLNNSIKDEKTPNNQDAFNYAKFKEKSQLNRSSSKNQEEENNKKNNNYENYFNYSKPILNSKLDSKMNESSSFMNEFKERKKIISRREHDSVSPMPTRGKSGSSPPKDSSKDKKQKVMSESVYSKTLLKRFQNSLKEKPYDNTYIRVLKDQNNNTTKQNEQENDVSPMRKVYDKSINSKLKYSDNSLLEQSSNTLNQRFQMQNNNLNNNNNNSYKNHQIKTSNNNINAKKTISPLQNNMNVNNLIQSVTGYQISSKNNNVSNNNMTNNNNNSSNIVNANSKNGPIRATYERKEMNPSLIPNKQISISNNPDDSFMNLNDLKSKNTAETSALNRPGSAPFRYYSPNSKLVVKSFQRSITPLSIPNTNEQQNQAKPRLRSSSPGTNNPGNNQNISNNAVNTSFQSNLFVYGYNSTAFQSKPKWKF